MLNLYSIRSFWRTVKAMVLFIMIEPSSELVLKNWGFIVVLRNSLVRILDVKRSIWWWCLIHKRIVHEVVLLCLEEALVKNQDIWIFNRIRVEFLLLVCYISKFYVITLLVLILILREAVLLRFTFFDVLIFLKWNFLIN